MALHLGRDIVAGDPTHCGGGRGRALAAAMLVLASPVAAGEPAPAPAAPATGEGAIVLDPISVEGASERQNAVQSPPGFVATQSSVGTKTDTPVLEIPQSVSVITRDQLTVRNVQSDPQALLYTPGVWAQPFGGDQNQNNPFFVIRGFTSAFGGSYVDGLVSPVNYRYEPFGIERFDVFRGPTSTLYGQSDPGGLVNRVSRRPPGEFEAELQAQAGSYERAQAAFDLGGPVDPNGRLLYRLTALQRDADAPIDYRFGQDAPDERQYIAPAATVNFGSNTSLTLLGNYLQDKVGQEAVFRKEDGDLSHIGLNQGDYGNVDYEHEMLGYAFQSRPLEWLELRQNFRYAHMDTSRVSFFQGVTDPTTTTVERFLDGFEEDRRDITADTQLQGDVRAGPLTHTLLGGLDYQHLRDRVTFSSGLAPSLNYRDPDYDQPVGDVFPLHQRALPERELRRPPAGPAEAGRLHPHHGCAPRLGQGHDRRPPGRER
jgi:iron complex outermembrane receptor protein